MLDFAKVERKKTFYDMFSVEIEEDEAFVQAYETEGTPHISKAPSLTDLKGCLSNNWQDARFTSGLQTPASEGPQEFAIEGSDWSEESEDETEDIQPEMVSRIVTYLPCQQTSLTYSLMNSRTSTPESLNR